MSRYLIFVLMGFSSIVFASRAHAEMKATPVKNAQQFLSSLSVATGVPLSDAQVIQTYEFVRTRLPVFGRIDEVTDPMLYAAGSLTGLFCQRMVDTEAAQLAANRRVFSLVDFTKGPVGMDSAIKTSILSNLSKYFYGRDLVTAEKDLLMASLDKVTAELTNDIVGTKNLSVLTCSKFGTSLEFLLY